MNKTIKTLLGIAVSMLGISTVSAQEAILDMEFTTLTPYETDITFSEWSNQYGIDNMQSSPAFPNELYGVSSSPMDFTLYLARNSQVPTGNTHLGMGNMETDIIDSCAVGLGIGTDEVFVADWVLGDEFTFPYGITASDLMKKGNTVGMNDGANGYFDEFEVINSTRANVNGMDGYKLELKSATSGLGYYQNMLTFHPAPCSSGGIIELYINHRDYQWININPFELDGLGLLNFPQRFNPQGFSQVSTKTFRAKIVPNSVGTINFKLSTTPVPFPSCTTEKVTADFQNVNVSHATFTNGNPTLWNQAWLKDANACGYTCTDGYTGTLCEIPPLMDCDMGSELFLNPHIGFTVGTPTSLNQEWVKGAENCGFVCNDGWSGDSCEIEPQVFSCNNTQYNDYVANYPNIQFTAGNPTETNQNYIKDAVSCGYTCINGYAGNLCNIAPEPLVSQPTGTYKVSFLKNKGFNINVSSDIGTNSQFFGTGYLDITRESDGTLTGSLASVSLGSSSVEKLNKVVSLVESNKSNISGSKKLSYFTNTNKDTSILVMNIDKYNKSSMLVDFIENVLSQTAVMDDTSSIYTKFIDSENGIVIFYKTK